MTNNWDDIEDLLKKKLSSGAGPMMDSEQMWANVSQSLPKRKRRWMFFGLAFLVLVGGAFGIIGDFGDVGINGDDGKSSRVGEYESARTELNQSGNDRDTLQGVFAVGSGDFGDIGINGDDGDDGKSSRVGEYGSARTELNQSGNDRDTLQGVFAVGSGDVGDIGDIGINGDDGKSRRIGEYGSVRTELNQSGNDRDTLQGVFAVGSGDIGINGDDGKSSRVGEYGSARTELNQSMNGRDTLQRVFDSGISDGEKIKSKTCLLNTSPSNLMSGILNNSSSAEVSKFRMEDRMSIYGYTGYNLPLLPNSENLEYAPIIGSEYSIGFSYMNRNNWILNLNAGASQLNFVVKYNFEKTSAYTYTNVPLHVFVDPDGNIIETQYGDTTVNQTINRKLIHNNLSTAFAFQSQLGKRFNHGRFYTEAFIGVKGLYILKQTGRYPINDLDFSLPAEANKYGWKSLIFLPGVRITESYYITRNWTAGLEMNYWLVPKNSIQTNLPKMGHIVGLGIHVNYFF